MELENAHVFGTLTLNFENAVEKLKLLLLQIQLRAKGDKAKLTFNFNANRRVNDVNIENVHICSM